MTDPRRPPDDVDGDDPTLPDFRRDHTAPVLLDEPYTDDLAEQIDSGEDEEVTSFAVRVDAWRRHYLPLPDEVVHEFLGEDEYVVHTDHPSFRAFLLKNAGQMLGLGTVGLLFLIFVRNGFDLWTVLLFLALQAILGFMALKRLSDRYTSYVITNLRLIRLSGIFGRKLASIPWTRMTGLGYRQKPMGRILGYATIFIESANEESGLREFSDINDPAAFHQKILDMVSAKSGQSSKDIAPPSRGERKSFLQRRRERRIRSLQRAKTQAQEMARSRRVSGDTKKEPDLAQPGRDQSPGPSGPSDPSDPSDPSGPSGPSGPDTPPGGTPAARTPPPPKGGPSGAGGVARPGPGPADDRSDEAVPPRKGVPPSAVTDPYGDPVPPARRTPGVPGSLPHERANEASTGPAPSGSGGPTTPPRGTPATRGRLWPGTGETPSVPAPPPRREKPAQPAQRFPADEGGRRPTGPARGGRLGARTTGRGTPAPGRQPGQPGKPPAPAPSEPRRKWDIPRLWRRSEGDPPVPPSKPEAPLVAPKVTTTQQPEERSARVHRWWRNTRPEEPTSARDALAALRQGQRQTRPTRRVRLPSFGKPRSPLPESRQLPAAPDPSSTDDEPTGADEDE